MLSLIRRSILLIGLGLVVSTNAFSSVAMTATGDIASAAKHVLFDHPVSNNGARCRIILYKKNIPSNEVEIVLPTTLGGLKDPAYLARNPQGLMPLLTVQSTGFNIPESDTIARYLISQYPQGPSFLPDDPKSNLIARLHDMYLTTTQGALYKPSSRLPLGNFGSRKDAIAEFRRQLNIINDLIEENRAGLYLCGSEVSLADATLFPTMIFAKLMLPKFGVPEEEALPSKIARWYDEVKKSDPDFAKVHDEVLGSLKTWEENGRWDTIWLAGLRDEAPPTLFDKIVAGEIPAAVVKEDSALIAFKDINPAAPAHVLVIPKDRAGLTNLRKATAEHTEILGRLLVAAGEIANDKELGFGDGARIVINDGKDGGQEVPHLHVHVLGGRQMTWPPG